VTAAKKASEKQLRFIAELRAEIQELEPGRKFFFLPGTAHDAYREIDRLMGLKNRLRREQTRDRAVR
jgi:hypothetical protein